MKHGPRLAVTVGAWQRAFRPVGSTAIDGTRLNFLY